MSQRNIGRSGYGDNQDYSENLGNQDDNPMGSGGMRRSGRDDLGQMGRSDDFDNSQQGFDDSTLGQDTGFGQQFGMGQQAGQGGMGGIGQQAQGMQGTGQQSSDMSGDTMGTTRQTRSSGRRGDDSLGDTYSSQDQYGSSGGRGMGQGRQQDTSGLGSTGGMGQGRRDDDSYGGNDPYGTSGQDSGGMGAVGGMGQGGDTSTGGMGGQSGRKGDSTMGKFVEKAGNVFGSKNMEQKGREKRLDQGLNE